MVAADSVFRFWVPGSGFWFGVQFVNVCPTNMLLQRGPWEQIAGPWEQICGLGSKSEALESKSEALGANRRPMGVDLSLLGANLRPWDKILGPREQT